MVHGLYFYPYEGFVDDEYVSLGEIIYQPC